MTSWADWIQDAANLILQRLDRIAEALERIADEPRRRRPVDPDDPKTSA